ncbi:8881_t:CDS:2 [Funneliformis geosporum]|uniref:8184_t:CDS:1 n=1 Tax=Funneliformis geosporum TaxID=1117311 RepID=A0A9W4WN94_9GLOM|nr:8881_t:CDS:2 [Funneliformis geosporum]CAI2174164.1 8184_t:CDS:2 [Funneliformis geosporum]
MGSHVSKKKVTLKPRNNYEEIFLLNKSLVEEYDYERMHLSHNLTREIFSGNFSSPVKPILVDKNSKILDVGCGAGYWLKEMSADFPLPKYFGVDMLPIFPKTGFPNRISFHQHDLLQGLPFEDDTFDFIHIQYLAFDFSETEWETLVYQELVRVLKPGGWLEVCDIESIPMNSGPITELINMSMCKKYASKNVDPQIVQRYESLLKSIPSFSSSKINHEIRNLPLGIWADKIGESGSLFMKETCRLFLQGKIGQDVNIKRKNINTTLDEISNEFELYQTFFNIHRLYVQMPN